MTAPDRLLTTDQVAEWLNVSRRSLEDWRYRGGGPPSITLGRKAVRYRESAVEAWLAEREAARAAG